MCIKLSSLPVFVLVVLLCSCGKEAPKCSDEKTYEALKVRIYNNLGDVSGIPKEVAFSGLSLKNTRAIGYDENIKRYSCESDLGVNSERIGKILFESQLGDKGEHIVSVGEVGNFVLYAIKEKLENFAIFRVEQEKKYDEHSKFLAEADVTPILGVASFSKGDPYGDVRKKMLAANWVPIVDSDFICYSGTCKGMPEMRCMATGLGLCDATWRKDAMEYSITTDEIGVLLAGGIYKK